MSTAVLEPAISAAYFPFLYTNCVVFLSFLLSYPTSHFVSSFKFLFSTNFQVLYIFFRRSHWPSGLKRRSAVASSNPAEGMDFCLLCLYVVLSCVGRSPTVCLYVCDQETPKREAKSPSWTISACEWMNKYIFFSYPFLNLFHFSSFIIKFSHFLFFVHFSNILYRLQNKSLRSTNVFYPSRTET
jgi:hypothetical protein